MCSSWNISNLKRPPRDSNPHPGRSRWSFQVPCSVHGFSEAIAPHPAHESDSVLPSIPSPIRANDLARAHRRRCRWWVASVANEPPAARFFLQQRSGCQAVSFSDQAPIRGVSACMWRGGSMPPAGPIEFNDCLGVDEAVPPLKGSGSVVHSVWYSR